MKENELKAMINELIVEFTQDIENLKDKDWLFPALISHIKSTIQRKTRFNTDPHMIQKHINDYIHEPLPENDTIPGSITLT